MYLRIASAAAIVAAAFTVPAGAAQTSAGPGQTGATVVPTVPSIPTDAARENAAPEACCKLAALTPVELEILTPASTKTSREGEEIHIRVVEPVISGDKVVIPSGTEGAAEVIQVSRGGFGGRAGELVIGAPYLMLAGQRINLKRFRYGAASGKDRTTQAVVATAVVGLVGMFVSGGNIDIASGTRANAVVTADTLVPIPQQQVTTAGVTQ